MTATEILNRATNAFRMKEFETAERLVRNLLEQRDDIIDLHIFMGNILAEQKRNEEAVKAFRDALALDSENAEALNNIGVVYKNEGNLPAAIESLEEAHAALPERADIAYNLGNFYKQEGNYPKAEQYYTIAIEEDPEFIPSYNNLGTMLEQNGEIERAERIYRRGLQFDPNHANLHYNLGVLLNKREQYDQALDEFRNAVRTRPRWVEGLNNLAISLQKTDRMEEAEKTFRNILKIDPNDTTALNNMGVLLSTKGETVTAERFFNRALENRPLYAQAALNLSKLYSDNGYFEQSLQQLTELRRRDPGNPEIRLNLAKVLIEMKQYDEAGEHLQFVLTDNPDSAEGHSTRGYLYWYMDKTDQALLSFEKTIALDPDNLDAILNRTKIFRQRHDLPSAVKEISKLLAIAPDHKEGRLYLANLQMEAEQYDAAYSLFQSLKTDYPDDHDILMGLIQCSRHIGKADEAVQYSENLIQHDDITAETLQAALAVYDESLEKYESLYGTFWDRNIREFSRQTEYDRREKEDEESVLFEDFPDLLNEIVPIIDMGGIDPVISINEEIDTLNLKEVEEDFVPYDELRRRRPENPVAKGSTPSARQASSGGSQESEQPVVKREKIIQHIYPQVYPSRPKKKKKKKKKPAAAPNKPQPRRAAKKPESVTKPPEASPPDLLGYLDNLTRFLPEESRDTYENGDMQLRLATLRSRLEGNEGLIHALERKSHDSESPQPEREPVSPDQLKSTLDFMAGLTDFHPDKVLAKALNRKLAAIKEKIQE